MASSDINFVDASHVNAEPVDLQKLLLQRVLAMAALAVTGVISYSWLGLHLPVTALLLILGSWTTSTIITWYRVSSKTSVPAYELLLLLLVDLLALTSLCYFSGGPTNPFVSLLLIPVATSAAAPWRHITWLILIFALICYTFLLFFYIPLQGLEHITILSDMNLHLAGMYLSFLFSACLIAYFVHKMTSTLQQREKMLAATRERMLRDEHLIAFGTLAASTAHELGTPLATAAILIGELDERQEDARLRHDKLATLRDQIYRCKNILGSLSHYAGNPRAESAHLQSADIYLKNLLNEWQILRPAVKLAYDIESSGMPPLLVADLTLSHAILNLLNNAADASPQDVRVHASWNKEQLFIEIRDQGKGFDQQLLERLGQEPIGYRPDKQGLGVGLYLSQAVFSRVNGQLKLNNHPEGGACCQVVLPLSAAGEVKTNGDQLKSANIAGG
jgi:two-component system sensor histidine kinase RegB